ncbi:MAG: polysaccharide deacetylase family protein [Clostridia bacterium]|nr:polysaccharide deacetylase family protein [Clostridia bacterium]
MIEYSIYPGEKTRIVTFSYDDGDVNDKKLVELFDLYGMKGTFCLNSRRFLEFDDEQKMMLTERYAGHEIASHTVHHGWPIHMQPQTLVTEIVEDRKLLEKIARYPVIGASYPFGSYNDKVEEVMRNCGIVYSRTTKSTHGFDLPLDFLAWHPTCHHRDAQQDCERFVKQLDYKFGQPLLYIWGHSFEFTTEEEWGKMESVLDMISGLNQVWYATNLEIYNYIWAQRQLKISMDEHIFCNPTSEDVWVVRNEVEHLLIPAGKTIEI